MTETKDLGAVLSDLSDLFEEGEQKYEADCHMFWKNLSEEDKLKAFFSVCKRIYKGDVEDRRSYRGVLYDVFGFGLESYTIGMQCGYDDIHRMVQEGIYAKEIMKDHANSMREDYTKSGDLTMNFIEVLNTGKIAIHPKMIGGWKMIDGKVYHRDNYDDFNYPDWIKENAHPYRIVMSGDEWYNMCENIWDVM